MKHIHLWGVKQNNLKNIDVKVPIGSFTVVCGPSGSGKSSLAFETLFAEGQRRFIESMSNYTRQFLNKAPKPDVEGVDNIPPSIAIEQKNAIRNSRSTVGTTTELIDYFRLLFEKLGQAHCPTHKIPTERESVGDAADKVLEHLTDQRGYILAEISAEDRVASGRELHGLLVQEGYLRIYCPKKSKAKKKATKASGRKNKKETSTAAAATGTEAAQSPLLAEELGDVIELTDSKLSKNGVPKDRFYVVIDRLAFRADDKGRIVDSIHQAYEAGQKFNLHQLGGRARVLTTEGQALQFSEENCCPICGYTPPPITSASLSFNSPVGACATCKGFGNILDIDEAKVVPNPAVGIGKGALHPFSMPSNRADKRDLIKFCKKHKIDLEAPWDDLPEEDKDLVWEGDSSFMGVAGLFRYLETKKYKMHVRVFLSRYKSPFRCPDCEGSRLRTGAKDVLLRGKNIIDLSTLTVEDLEAEISQWVWTEYEEKVAGEIIRQLKSRLNFLLRVGVNYLSLSRETRTLSGGEYQRLLLANQLGMGLSQALYVLDEPTVGLHPRDNDRLISILKDLRNLGNTLVVVEHDHDVIRSSDNIIEMGPGSGIFGGEVIFSGETESFYDHPGSSTNIYLKPRPQESGIKSKKPIEDIQSYRYKLSLKGARGNNLKNLDVDIPLNRLVTVTGVSGSGKSTLVSKTLYPALAHALEVEYPPFSEYDDLHGIDLLKNVLLIDQTPIGKSARSNPVTYLKVYDSIRQIFAEVREAKDRGYTPGTFSLNVDGGRCPVCRGAGVEEIDMMFMDNVIIPCDACDGKKFRDEILEIKHRGRNINDVLNMTVQEAMDFFVSYPAIRKPLSILKEVGLDYLRLGQSASSLSGGESQRLKIAKQLSAIKQKNTLYILDEPTTGLHFREVDLLLEVLHKLVDSGGSVLVVEHNLDVVRSSDYIIDLGPEAGAQGGQIVFTGSPDELLKVNNSLTGQYLKSYIEEQFGSDRDRTVSKSVSSRDLNPIR